MLVGISIEERNTRSLHVHCKTAPNHRSLTLRIDKGSPGAAALLGTYIKHYANYVGIVYIL